MKYAEAREIAIMVGAMLLPYCSKLNIAGSIRRGKPEVKDIELVCLPLRVKATLFGDDPGDGQVSPDFVKVVADIGWPVKGEPSGRQMVIKLKEGINLDLFMPQPDDYYRQYAIRTGSSEYSHQVLAAGWVAKGWVGVTGLGLRRRTQCYERIQPTGGKKTYALTVPDTVAEKPPVWQSEEEFFNWLDIPWIEPQKRHVSHE